MSRCVPIAFVSLRRLGRPVPDLILFPAAIGFVMLGILGDRPCAAAETAGADNTPVAAAPASAWSAPLRLVPTPTPVNLFREEFNSEIFDQMSAPSPLTRTAQPAEKLEAAPPAMEESPAPQAGPRAKLAPAASAPTPLPAPTLELPPVPGEGPIPAVAATPPAPRETAVAAGAMPALEAAPTAAGPAPSSVAGLRKSLNRLRRNLDQAWNQKAIKKNFTPQLRRMERQLEAARIFLDDGDLAETQNTFDEIQADLDAVVDQAARRKNAAEEAPEEIPRPAKHKAEATETVKPAETPVAPKVSPTPVGEADEQLRKKARGAYGRVVKLMLDIDKMNGPRFFPQDYAGLQDEARRIKVLLVGEDYQAAITYAEAMFPKLEKLHSACAEKDRAHEVMPTNW